MSNLLYGCSPGNPVSSTNKTDRHDIDITDILLKMALNIIKPTNQSFITLYLRLKPLVVVSQD